MCSEGSLSVTYTSTDDGIEEEEVESSSSLSLSHIIQESTTHSLFNEEYDVLFGLAPLPPHLTII